MRDIVSTFGKMSTKADDAQPEVLCGQSAESERTDA